MAEAMAVFMPKASAIFAETLNSPPETWMSTYLQKNAMLERGAVGCAVSAGVAPRMPSALEALLNRADAQAPQHRTRRARLGRRAGLGFLG
eukprot:SAG31_NODE_5398_length_2560_cov_2.708537_3_plen_91_part_00